MKKRKTLPGSSQPSEKRLTRSRSRHVTDPPSATVAESDAAHGGSPDDGVENAEDINDTVNHPIGAVKTVATQPPVPATDNPHSLSEAPARLNSPPTAGDAARSNNNVLEIPDAAESAQDTHPADAHEATEQSMMVDCDTGEEAGRVASNTEQDNRAGTNIVTSALDNVTYSQARKTRTISAYEEKIVHVDVLKLCVPDRPVRPVDVDSESVAQFATIFARNEYGEGGRLISVIIAPNSTADSNNVTKMLIDGIVTKENPLTSIPGIRVLVSDGLHRLHALRSPRVQLNATPPANIVLAKLYTRKGGFPLTIGDSHTIACRQNQMDMGGRKTTVFDRIYTCLTVLLDTLEMSDTEVTEDVYSEPELTSMRRLLMEPKVSTLKSLLLSRGVIDNYSESTHERYCTVALGLAQFHETPSVLTLVRESMKKGDTEENVDLPLSFLLRQELWEGGYLPKFMFFFKTFVSLRHRFRISDPVLPPLCRKLSEFWNKIVKLIQDHDLSLDDGLAVRVSNAADNSDSDSDPDKDDSEMETRSVLDRIISWMGDLNRNEFTDEDEWKKRQKFLMYSVVANGKWPRLAPIPDLQGSASASKTRVSQETISFPTPEGLSIVHTGEGENRETDEPMPNIGDSPPSIHATPLVPDTEDDENANRATPDNDDQATVTETDKNSKRTGQELDDETTDRENAIDVPTVDRDSIASRLRSSTQTSSPQKTPIGHDENTEKESSVPKPRQNSSSDLRVEPTSTAHKKKSKGQRKALTGKPTATTRDKCTIKDVDGFHVRRRFDGGFYYKQPKYREGLFKKVEYVKDTNDSEGGGMEGFISDHDSVRLYKDYFETKILLDYRWKLEILPSQKDKIWREKYCIPTSHRSLTRKFGGEADKQALLRSMGFRPPHMAFFHLSLKDLSHIRYSVYEYIFRWTELPADKSDWQTNAEATFEEKRNTFDAQGYIIMEGFVLRDMEKGTYSTEDRDDYRWPEMAKDVRDLFRFFEDDVPKNESELMAKEYSWSRIRNGKALPVDVAINNSRWTTTTYATNTRLQEDETQHLLRARCYVEFANWVLIHWLHLEADFYDEIPDEDDEEDDSPPIPPLYATDAGSKVLVTSEECSDQIAHLDFFLPPVVARGEYPQVVEYMGLFMISFGKDGGKLWILPGSHQFVFLDEEAKKEMSKHIGLVAVKIPPWSTIIARGDLVHAGMGGAGVGKKACARLHDFGKRYGKPLVDTIHDQPHWKPIGAVLAAKRKAAKAKARGVKQAPTFSELVAMTHSGEAMDEEGSASESGTGREPLRPDSSPGNSEGRNKSAREDDGDQREDSELQSSTSESDGE